MKVSGLCHSETLGYHGQDSLSVGGMVPVKEHANLHVWGPTSGPFGAFFPPSLPFAVVTLLPIINADPFLTRIE